MKTKFNSNLFLLITIIFLSSQYSFSQGDINLKLSETSINQTLQVLVDSKAINFARYDGSYGLSTYNINITGAQAVLNPSGNGNIRLDLDLTARATFNLILFHFDANVTASLGIYGMISKVQQDQGYKLIMDPQEVAYFSSTGTFLDDIVEDEINGFITQLPEITIASYTSLLPSIVSQYFTPESPILTVTTDEVILSLIIAAGPRYITVYNDLNQQTNIGNVQDEEGTNNYVSYPSPKTFAFNSGTIQKLQTPIVLLDASNGKNKYKYWFKGWETIPQTEIAPRRIQLTVGSQDETYRAKFDLAKHVQLSNLLEGQFTGGTVTYESTTAPAFDDYDFYNTLQSHPINSNVPNGTLGINWVFQKWSDGNTNQSRNIVLSNDINLTANYKGKRISDNTAAYSTTSQRKYVKTDDGYLHMVYESMGKAWYEISTNNGSTWQIANNGQPLSGSEESKLPAIDYRRDFVVIVWQEKISGAYTIKLAEFGAGVHTYVPTATIFEDGYLPYSTNTNPVVALDGEGRIMVMWKRDEDNVGYWPVGIVFCYGSFGFFGWTEMDFGLIPTTNSNSINPTVVADKDYNLIPAEYHLAWEQPAGFYTDIKYFELYRDGYNKILPRTSSPETPSNGAGFWTNRKPSIIVLNDHTPRLVWIGYTPWYGSRTVLRAKQTNGLWSSTIYNYTSYYTESANINRTNDNNYIFTFSASSAGLQNKYVKNSSLYTIRDLGTTGKDIQVCNGTNYQLMSAMVFNSTTLPFYFLKSTTDFSSVPQVGGAELNKITVNDTIVTFGRSGVVSINDIEFLFNIGDILVGDSIIKFNDIPDTLVYTSTNDLNQYTRTNNFTLTPETNFYFSNIYFVVQKSNPETALTSLDAVNFKAELVNAISNQVVGTFDNITYNKNNLEKYASVDYEVDCSGITLGEYYLRLVTSVNGDAYFSLANIISDNTILAKKNFNKVNFIGSEIPATYDLAQNFPNPFNPSTTIRYQIPQDGIVTLKIYDILGAEVKILVNEVKVAGKYEVNFNASSLASGVYIYRISVSAMPSQGKQAGEFTASRKLILLK